LPGLTKKPRFDKLYQVIGYLLLVIITKMIAIIETGGKQYLVKAGDKIQIEKLPATAGSVIKFDKVLFISKGTDAAVGKPYISGAAVEGKVLKQGRAKKIHVLKYKAKSKYRRKIGHRQHYTEIEITKV
jgi:large subunit ribosomal protein L21